METHGGDDGELGEETSGAAREHYIDVGPSELRKLQDSLSDPKYDGVQTSRKDLQKLEYEDGSDFESEDEEDGFPILHRTSSGEESDEPEGSEAEDTEMDDDEGSEEGTENGADESPVPPSRPPKRQVPEQDHSEDPASALKQAREADKRKGQAVKKQIALWDTLLDSRIQIQKAVVAANKLPAPGVISRYIEDPDCAAALLKFSQEALAFADDLANLQEKLFVANETLDVPPRKKRKLNDEESSLSSVAEDLIAACESNASFEYAYHPHLVQTLAKWSAKIQAVAPSVLLPSNRGAFAKGKQQLKSAVQLVDDTLQDSQGLIARTRLRRAPGTRIKPAVTEDGESDTQREDEDIEIFDDTDFYQKMLRDIIDARGGGDGKDADWLAIQKQKKAKKEVDTKASKGRKIRYHVHEKIQNFMMPIPNVGGWHEEQIDELFSSLLGKGFEGAVVDVNHEETRTEEPIVHDGFRVFG